MENSNQWELNGDCSICRRKKYCSKDCTRRKRRINAEIRGLTKAFMNEMTVGVMRESIDKDVDGVYGGRKF